MKALYQGTKPLKLVLVLTILFSFQSVIAQPISIGLSAEKSSTEVKQSDFNRAVFQFNFQSLQGINVETEKGVFTEFFLEGGHYVGEFGTPKLPASKHLIEIPFGADVDVEVVRFSKSTIKLSEVGVTNLIMPAQPMLRKDQDPSEVKFEFKPEAYADKSFNEELLAKIDILGVLRGVRIAQLTVAPIRYNPSEGILEVYNDLEIEINYRNADISRTMIAQASTFSPYFEPVYNRLKTRLPSKNLYNSHPDLTKNPIKMVIVSNRMFQATLQPFIEWKTQQGIYVTVGYTDVIGTTVTAIRNFIHGIYNAATPDNPAPTFVIMVGDPATMPASANGSATNSVTDLYYASVDGDMFPEMYYGRLSARNVQELQNQIDKILYYQRYEFADPTYLNNVTLIAGQDATWNPRIGQPTVKYGTANYFNAANGFATVWGYGVANDPNNPNNSPGYAGCYDNARISVSLINFTAHCSPTSWADPTLTTAMVHAMTNTGKYPLAIGNCCKSSLFSNPESIGEAWVRAQNKGAVAYIGSAPNTHWFNDFYWAVGAFPIVGQNDGYVPTVAQTTVGAYDAPFVSDYLSVAALKFVGNLAITTAAANNWPTHQSALYYWQAYHTFGDPSTYIYLKEGLTNQVTHLPIVPIGLSTYTVNALPGSYVGISKNGVLHGAAFVGATGEVAVPIQPILEGGNVMIVVTKPQHIPYIMEVPAAALEGPFIVVDNFVINDQSGNNNGLADYGESFSINLTLKNVGANLGANITATLSGSDDFFSATTTGPVHFGNIAYGASGNTATVNDAFSFTLTNNVPNQHQATFVLTITSGDKVWTSNIRIKAQAPVLSIGSITIDDNNQGIPGVLDAGETANAVIQVFNAGNSAANNVAALLTTQSPFLSINGSPTINITSLPAGQSATAAFSVTANANTPLETSTVVNLDLRSGHYSANKDLTIIVGFIPVFNMQNGQVSACIGRFYDSGGVSGDYSNNENLTMTFMPTNPQARLLFNFTSFNTENTFDRLFIYNGPNSSSPQFPGSPFMGTVSPGTVMATNEQGAITFVFTSDGSVVRPGWAADFFCIDLSVPPSCATNPTPPIGQVVNASPVTLGWNPVPGAVEYDVFIGVESLPQTVTATVATNSFNFIIQEYSNYVWKVVPKNGSGSAAGCPVWSFFTAQLATIVNMHNGSITTCNALFYDSGGPSANYSGQENLILTFNPAIADAMLRVQFITFDVESQSTCNFDRLLVYDGPNTQSTLLGRFCGTSIPGPFTSTNGPLTFHFISDNSVVRSGWSAQVSCHGPFHDVTFTVTSPSGPVEGALVKVGNKEGTTNASGMVVLQGLQAGTSIYNVTKIGFLPASGTFVVAANAPVYISLLPLYIATFTIKSNQNPIEGASIDINNGSVVSNSNGLAYVNLINGTYPYLVTKNGFQQVAGQLVVNGQNVEVDINLQPLYTVTFQVATSGGPLFQAEIKIAGQTLLTNSVGRCSLSLIPGTYNYSVKYLEFPTVSGSLNVIDDDKFLPVLIETSVYEPTLNEVALFPNPFNSKINLTGTHNVKFVTISTITGQEVLKIDNQGANTMEIPTGGLSAGIYLVKLVGPSNQTIIRKMVKQR